MKIQLYIQAVKYKWEKEFTVRVESFQRTQDNQQSVISLDELEFEIDVPEFDAKTLMLKEVEHLESQLKEEKQASFERITQLEERIQSLMCIEVQS